MTSGRGRESEPWHTAAMLVLPSVNYIALRYYGMQFESPMRLARSETARPKCSMAFAPLASPPVSFTLLNSQDGELQNRPVNCGMAPDIFCERLTNIVGRAKQVASQVY